MKPLKLLLLVPFIGLCLPSLSACGDLAAEKADRKTESSPPQWIGHNLRLADGIMPDYVPPYRSPHQNAMDDAELTLEFGAMVDTISAFMKTEIPPHRCDSVESKELDGDLGLRSWQIPSRSWVEMPPESTEQSDSAMWARVHRHQEDPAKYALSYGTAAGIDAADMQTISESIIKIGGNEQTLFGVVAELNGSRTPGNAVDDMLTLSGKTFEYDRTTGALWLGEFVKVIKSDIKLQVTGNHHVNMAEKSRRYELGLSNEDSSYTARYTSEYRRQKDKLEGNWQLTSKGGTPVNRGGPVSYLVTKEGESFCLQPQ